MSGPEVAVETGARPPAPTPLLVRIVDALALAATYLAALCLVALIALVTAEVALTALARLFKSLPSGISVAWEYSAYLMGSSFMLGSGLTLRAGSHVRVELLLKGGRARLAHVYEIASALVGSVVCGLMAWTFTAFAIRSFVGNQLSQDSFTPLWIPQVPLAVGAIILALEMVVRLWAALTGRSVDNERFRMSTSTTE